MNNTNSNGNSNNSNNNNIIKDDIPQKKRNARTRVRKVKKANNNDNVIIVEDELDDNYEPNPRPVKRAKRDSKKIQKKSEKKSEKESEKEIEKVSPFDTSAMNITETYSLLSELLDANRILAAENEDLKRQLNWRPKLKNNQEEIEDLNVPSWAEDLLKEKDDLSAQLSAKGEEFKSKEEEMKKQELEIKKLKEKSQEKVCGICMEEPTSMVANPCGHIFGCHDCIVAYNETNKKCAICRQYVEKYFIMFNS
jgi:hypothetical protein